MATYQIIWDNEHASGTLSGTFTSRRAAEKAAREWRREMVDIERTAEARKEARLVYSWEVVKV